MSKPVTHQKSSAASRSRRANGVPRYAWTSMQTSWEPREKKARSAWIAAADARKAVQASIAAAFGRYLDGSGPELPVTERMTAQSLILPLFHDLAESDQDRIIDGRGVGTTPIPAIPLPPGPHTVVLRNAELDASRTLPVVIKPGKPTLLRVDLRRAEQP